MPLILGCLPRLRTSLARFLSMMVMGGEDPGCVGEPSGFWPEAEPARGRPAKRPIRLRLPARADMGLPRPMPMAELDPPARSSSSKLLSAEMEDKPKK